MPRMCHHTHKEPQPDICPVCKLYMESPEHRARWDSGKHRPCDFVHPEPEAFAGDCRLCWLYLTQDKYNRRWGGPGLSLALSAPVAPPTLALTAVPVPPAPPATRPSPPTGVLPGRTIPLPACRHLGQPTGEIRPCQACGGRKEEPVYACAVFGECTPTTVVSGLNCCRACDKKDPTFPIRDLAFHLLPVAGNGVWQRHAARLRASWNLFTGKKVIAVCTGPFVSTDEGRKPLDPPEAVQAALPDDAEFVLWPNDPNLREAGALPLLLERLQSHESGRAIFYGQSKGVTRPVNQGVSVIEWTNLLYASLLDYWPVVEALLASRPLVGSMKKIGKGFDSLSSWHYSGSFFWARSRDLFARNWRHVDQQWWGAESWPGLHFASYEAGTVFHEGTVGGPRDLNLYDMAYLQNTVLPAWAKWQEQHAHQRTAIP